MSYNIFEAYAVHKICENEYGRGDIDKIFLDKYEAKIYATKRGYYGGDADITDVYIIEVDEKQLFLLRDTEPVKVHELDELSYHDELAKAQLALSKLSDIERQLIQKYNLV